MFKKVWFIIALIAAVCLCGCDTAPGGETTAPVDTALPAITPPPETTASTETTAPPETTEATEPVVNTIAWRLGPDGGYLYSYEDYFAFERFYHGIREDLQEHLVADSVNYEPFVLDGKLYIQDLQETLQFQVGTESYEDLRVLGTDGFYWIYCVEASKELFRIDPYGNQQSLFSDPSGKIASSATESGGFRLEEYGNVAFFTAGCEDGYGIYRIHLPSATVEKIASAENIISLWRVTSNYQVSWFEGEYKGGEEEIFATPAKEWDLSDGDIAKFQKLLSPSENGSLKGRNNWYNMASFLFFESPEKVSLTGLLRCGFRDMDTKLTDKELAYFGDKADPDADYNKLPADRIEQVLRYVFGIGLADMEENNLATNENTLYYADKDTYYRRFNLAWNDEAGKETIYIYRQNITVHQVVEQEDGTVWVYYLPETPSPFSSGVDWTENLMVLRQEGDSYKIVSNQKAVFPMAE